MGRAQRPRPARLAEKLRQIRQRLDLSQSELVAALGLAGESCKAEISKFELGRREPPALILLRYARLANVFVEALLDDELDLPRRLPCTRKHEGIRRRAKRLVAKNSTRIAM